MYNRLKVSIGRKKKSQNRNPESLFSSEDAERNAQTYRAAAGSFGHFEKYTYQLSSESYLRIRSHKGVLWRR